MESTCRVEVLDRLGRVTVSEKPYHLRQHLRRAVVQPAVFRRDPQRMVELARGGSAQERQDLGRVMAHRGHDEIRCHRRQHAEHLRREVPGVVVGVDGPGDVERAAGYRSRRGRVRAGESARHAREGAQVAQATGGEEVTDILPHTRARSANPDARDRPRQQAASTAEQQCLPGAITVRDTEGKMI